MRTPAYLAAIALFVIPVASRAVPTGLNTMPTADVLTMAETNVTYEFGGSGKLYADPKSPLIGSQTGLSATMEGGVDHVSDGSTVYNLKLAIMHEGILMPGVAVGAQNIGSHRRVQYYAVASKSVLPMKLAQVSAGVLRDNDKSATLTMVGARAKLGPVVVQADQVTGSTVDKRSSVGAGIVMSGVTVFGTLYHYADGPVERDVTVSYAIRGF